MKTKIKKGDTVKVISGKFKGSQGTVLEVLREDGRVRIEGVAPIKKHVKPQRSAKNPEGGIIEGTGSIPLSHVMVVSEKLGRPVRTGAVETAEGKKVRVARGRNLKAEQV